MNSLRAITTIAALTVSLLAGVASAQTITFTSLPQGSLINFQVTVLSKLLLDKTDLKVRVVPMAGTEAQMTAIERGEAQFMLTDVTQSAAALQGQETWAGRPLTQLRAAGKLITFPVSMLVRKDSPFRTIADLKGKRLPSGWTAFSQGGVLQTALLATAGLTMKDVVGVPTPQIIRALDDLKAGRIDATMVAIGVPKVREVDAALGGVRFLPIENTSQNLAAVRTVRKDFYLSLVKPAPHLVAVVEPTYMLAFDLALTTGANVPDDVVAKVVTAVYENKAALAAGHPSFRGFEPAEMGKQFSVLTYHPAAIKFLKEHKVWPGP